MLRPPLARIVSAWHGEARRAGGHLPEPSTRGRPLSFSAAKVIAWRYALAPVCIGAAVLLHQSPVGALLHPTGPFILGVLVAAWFGGTGPGVFAALLSAISVPQLIAVTG